MKDCRRAVVLLMATAVILIAEHTPGQAATFETKVLSVDLPQVRVAAGGATGFTVTIRIEPDYHTMANPASEEFLIPLVLTSKSDQFGLDVRYPPGTDYRLLPGSDPIKVYGGEVTLSAQLSARAWAKVGPATMPLDLRYQACTESNCLPPETLPLELSVEVLPAGSAVEGALEPAPGETVDTGGDQQTAAGELADALGKGWLWVALAVYLGGLALNLTPCVFPLLPVTMGFFASQGEHRVSRTLPMALVYVLSMTAVFTALGVAAALAGSRIGAFIESFAGRVTIAAILALLAASLFGAFEIRVPSGLLSRLQGRAGLAGAAIMGLAVGLVAAPCVGPFVSALVLFVAARQSVAVGAILFFLLALGLGTPYLFLGMATGLVNRVPRGGGYLLWFRRVLAFPILALIVYFLRADLPEWLLWTLFAAVALAGAVYLGIVEGWSRQPWSRRFVVARVAVAVLFTAAATAAVTLEVMPAVGLGGASRGRPLVWQDFRDGALEQAAEAGRPAVLYFTSKTCSYCWAMDRTVFRGDEVLRAAQGVELLKVNLDRKLSAEAERLQKKYAPAGPPSLVFFDRTGHELAHRNRVTRSEFLSLLARLTGPPN